MEFLPRSNKSHYINWGAEGFVQKEDIAEQMNNHFCSLGSKLASGIPDTASQPKDFLNRTDLNFCFRPLNVGYILNLISNLKPSVSCGLDNI